MQRLLLGFDRANPVLTSVLYFRGELLRVAAYPHAVQEAGRERLTARLAQVQSPAPGPSVAEKRIFGALSVCIVDGEVRAACVPFEIAQLYAALLHFRGCGLSNLMVTDTASKGGYAPTLLVYSDIDCSEHPFRHPGEIKDASAFFGRSVATTAPTVA
jgi:hypothetical protein